MNKSNLTFFLEKKKKPLSKIKDFGLPNPNPYHVLVKIKYSGICGSQIKEIEGRRGVDKYLPHLLGHEGYGQVIKIGEKVKKLKKNDSVLLSWIKGTGGEEKNLKIKFKKKDINSGQISTFSCYSLISENRCFKVSTNDEKKFYPILGCSLPTGFGLIYRDLKPKNNKIFILSGFGGIGIFSYLAINLFKPKKIIVIENNIKKIKILNKINKKVRVIRFNNKEETLKKILKITNGEFADYVVDTSGNINAMNNCLNYLKNDGKFVFASHPNHKDKLIIDPHELIKGKQIYGSWGGGFHQEKDRNIIKNFYRKQFLNSNMKKLIKFYPLKKINNALNDLKSGKVFKVLLEH
jgi:S-(hydroxymethyl)glutathione dehydrogenase / alcohol dehydrogenase